MCVFVCVCVLCVCVIGKHLKCFFAVGGNFIAHVCWGFRMWYCSPSNGFWHYQIFWWLCSLFIVFSDSFISCASYSKRSGACQGFLLSSFAATAKVIAMVKTVLVRKFIIALDYCHGCGSLHGQGIVCGYVHVKEQCLGLRQRQRLLA